MSSTAHDIVSSDSEELILVNSDDEILGNMAKIDCHLGDGILHRAFSVFIFNEAGQVLLQKRSEQKMLWPLYWSNACCSHPRAGESSEGAAHRRLQQELGVDVELTFLYKFQYQQNFLDIGSEHELCWVWIGTAEADEISANPNEIADWQFVDPDELDESLTNNPKDYTPWMKMEWQKIFEDFAHLVPKTRKSN